jgi:hypothetical protein
MRYIGRGGYDLILWRFRRRVRNKRVHGVYDFGQMRVVLFVNDRF